MVQDDSTRRQWQPTPAHRYESFPVLPLEDDWEAHLRFPPGAHRIVLGLGGIPVEIRTDDADLFEYLSNSYGPLAEEREPLVRLSVAHRDELPVATQLGTLALYERGSRLLGRFRGMFGDLDTAEGSGRALIAGRNYRQDLLNYFRLVINAMCPAQNALLYHTAAVARDGFAYVFYGASTAGKSTISTLAARRHEVMTDDMLVLRLEGGELRAATCGFWGGETNCYPTKRIDLPVQGFYSLVKASVNRLTPLTAMSGALDLVCGVPSIARSVADHQRILEFASVAATKAPFYRLEFHKNDDSFWSVIDEQ